jgi:adenosylhomocysteine nucleosidase
MNRFDPDIGRRLAISRLGIIVGMVSEAHIAQRVGCAVAVGGGRPDGARRMAERLVLDGATALVSFGLAGGLDPALAAGDMIVPRAVLHEGAEYVCDPYLYQHLAAGGRVVERLVAAENIVASTADKRHLWELTGAAAVDLESGVVAQVAAASGLPFAVLRAICDPASRSLPSAAVEALDETGRVRPMKMAGILARHPQQIFALIALGRDAARGRLALIRGAESLRRFAPGHAHLG